jgi:tetratricopeptide (TPR) repeat protein
MKLYILIFCICFIALSLNAESNEVLFDKANQFYSKKEYNNALVIYTQLEKNKIISANLLENTANTYLKLGKYPEALLYYERAKKYTTETTQIDAILNKIITDYKLENTKTTNNVVEFFAKKISRNTIAITCIFMSVILIIIIVLYIRKKISLQKIYSSIAIYIIAIIFINYIAYTNYNVTEKSNQVIILKSNSLLKSTPSESASDNYEIPAVSKFEIKDKIGNWYLLQNQFGKNGWANEKDLGKI